MSISENFSRVFLGTLVAASLVISGCATVPASSPGSAKTAVNPLDPLEPLNRRTFQFNDTVDTVIFKPVTQAYQEIAPRPVRLGVKNFFGNLSDVWSVANNAMQGRPVETVETLMRVGVNTVLGFGGLIDIASDMQLEKNKQDFGQTLGRWGVPFGPYVVLPFFGPSSTRDFVGVVVDAQADLVTQYGDVPVRNSLNALRIVDTRTNFLLATEAIEKAALDKYSFTRDSYIQRRTNRSRQAAEAIEERFDLPEPAPAGAPPAAAKPQ
jgi:phospholipid-binding lipoprotein MlaA